MWIRRRRRPGSGVAPRQAEHSTRWIEDWEEYLDRKVLLDRARKAQVEAFKELYDRYGLRLLLAEERLPDRERRALMAYIAAPSR